MVYNEIVTYKIYKIWQNLEAANKYLYPLTVVFIKILLCW